MSSFAEDRALWAEMKRQSSKQTLYDIVHANEMLAQLRWHEHPLNSSERRVGWLVRQAIDAMCARISAGKL